MHNPLPGDKQFSRSASENAAIPAQRIAGIVVALPEELKTLTSRKLAQGECLALNKQLILVYSGAGAGNAERCAGFLIDQGVNCLISWGCAAALSTELKAGDLILPDRVLSADNRILNVDRDCLNRMQTLLSGRRKFYNGLLVESHRIVAAGQDKLKIFQQTAGIALDMESAAVLKAAHQANLPGLVIRAIADTATMDLPQAVAQAINSQGIVELPKLLRFLAAHPWEIPSLIRLGLHFNRAGKTLKKLAKLLESFTNY